MEIFGPLRDFSMLAVAGRLLAALLCGSAIGLDREMRNKKAGLKTHALVCVGAALCIIVSESISLGRDGVTTDMTRIAANVVTGVGFLCASTLMTRSSGYVSGLTTAAGLWTTAIVGLACGTGWVEIAFAGAVVVLLIFWALSHMDDRIAHVSRGFDLYAEISHYDELPRFLDCLHSYEVHFTGLKVSKSPVGDGAIVQLTAQTAHLGEKQRVLEVLRGLDCVSYLESF